MQNAKRGKVHQSWEDIFDSANGAPLVRVMILGNTIVVPTTPEAADYITRKHKFIPKMRSAYAGFAFMVRRCQPCIALLLASTTRAAQACAASFTWCSLLRQQRCKRHFTTSCIAGLQDAESHPHGGRPGARAPAQRAGGLLQQREHPGGHCKAHGPDAGGLH